MGALKTWLIEQEVERIEKIIESYPPEEQKQIYAGTWQIQANRQKREPAQGKGPKRATLGLQRGKKHG